MCGDVNLYCIDSDDDVHTAEIEIMIAGNLLNFVEVFFSTEDGVDKNSPKRL